MIRRGEYSFSLIHSLTHVWWGWWEAIGQTGECRMFIVSMQVCYSPLSFSSSAMPRDTDGDQCLNGQRMDKTAGQDEGEEKFCDAANVKGKFFLPLPVPRRRIFCLQLVGKYAREKDRKGKK